MVPRPSSPASLLWAYQLKLEHKYLLERITKVESCNDLYSARLDLVANAAADATKSADIDKVAKRIQALEDSSLGPRIAKVEKELREQLETLHAENETLTLQVDALDAHRKQAEKGKVEAFHKEMALLRKLAGLEASMLKKQEALQTLEQSIDDADVDGIKQQIAAALIRVDEERNSRQILTQKVGSLEAGFQQIVTANQRFQAEITKDVADARKTSSEIAAAAHQRPQNKRAAKDPTSSSVVGTIILAAPAGAPLASKNPERDHSPQALTKAAVNLAAVPTSSATAKQSAARRNLTMKSLRKHTQETERLSSSKRKKATSIVSNMVLRSQARAEASQVPTVPKSAQVENPSGVKSRRKRGKQPCTAGRTSGTASVVAAVDQEARVLETRRDGRRTIPQPDD